MNDQGANNDLLEASEVDQIAKLQSDCLFNLGQMHQYGLGVDKDASTALRYYRQSASLFDNFKSYSKCADFYYSRGEKASAMSCYKKAYELGDVSALNSMALM